MIQCGAIYAANCTFLRGCVTCHLNRKALLCQVGFGISGLGSRVALLGGGGGRGAKNQNMAVAPDLAFGAIRPFITVLACSGSSFCFTPASRKCKRACNSRRLTQSDTHIRTHRHTHTHKQPTNTHTHTRTQIKSRNTHVHIRACSMPMYVSRLGVCVCLCVSACLTD